MPLRGEVWEVNLDPCVVISNDLMNTKMGLSIVVPFTGTGWYTKSGKLSPAMVEVLPPEGGLTKPCYSMAFQVRTVPQSRLTRRLGRLTSAKLTEIVQSIEALIDQ